MFDQPMFVQIKTYRSRTMNINWLELLPKKAWLVLSMVLNQMTPICIASVVWDYEVSDTTQMTDMSNVDNLLRH